MEIDLDSELFRYMRILESLREWRGPRGGRHALAIADVAFFYGGMMRSWFFTSQEDGTLRRKHRAHLSCADFVAALCRRPSSLRTGESVDTLALAVLCEPSGAAWVAPLDAEALRWLLLGPASEQVAVRMKVIAVTRYVPPRSGREAVLRIDWRSQLRGYELRSSRAPLAKTSLPVQQLLTTHHPLLLAYSKQEVAAPPSALQAACAACERIAARLQGGADAGARRVCADFKLAANGQVLLMWASMPRADAAFPAAVFPASMTIRRLDLTLAPPIAAPPPHMQAPPPPPPPPPPTVPEWRPSGHGARSRPRPVSAGGRVDTAAFGGGGGGGARGHAGGVTGGGSCCADDWTTSTSARASRPRSRPSVPVQGRDPTASIASAAEGAALSASGGGGGDSTAAAWSIDCDAAAQSAEEARGWVGVQVKKAAAAAAVAAAEAEARALKEAAAARNGSTRGIGTRSFLCSRYFACPRCGRVEQCALAQSVPRPSRPASAGAAAAAAAATSPDPHRALSVRHAAANAAAQQRLEAIANAARQARGGEGGGEPSPGGDEGQSPGGGGGGGGGGSARARRQRWNMERKSTMYLRQAAAASDAWGGLEGKRRRERVGRAAAAEEAGQLRGADYGAIALDERLAAPTHATLARRARPRPFSAAETRRAIAATAATAAAAATASTAAGARDGRGGVAPTRPLSARPAGAARTPRSARARPSSAPLGSPRAVTAAPENAEDAEDAEDPFAAPFGSPRFIFICASCAAAGAA